MKNRKLSNKYFVDIRKYSIFAACLIIEHVAKDTKYWREKVKIIGI